MKANTVTLLNNVVVSQGPNVLRGERLVVDLTTGVSKVDAGNSSGPVRMLIQNGVPQPQSNGRRRRRKGSSQRSITDVDTGSAPLKLPANRLSGLCTGCAGTGAQQKAEPLSWTADVLDDLLSAVSAPPRAPAPAASRRRRPTAGGGSIWRRSAA